MSVINTHGHCARTNFYVYNQSPVSIFDLSSNDMIEWLEETKSMRLTVRCVDSAHPWEIIELKKLESVTQNGTSWFKTWYI